MAVKTIIRTCAALAALGALGALGGCSISKPVAHVALPLPAVKPLTLQAEPAAAQDPIHAMVSRYAHEYNVPEALVHRVVKRESTYNPKARNGVHYGLMQINPETARTMGYRGSNEGLYDAETNLKFGVKYLRGAWLLADGSHDRAVRLYSAGYYYEAKRRGMLVETGLRKPRK
ncbi:lytic transglycosylase domain-containing protein [Oricola sp.]|uniref:lytic transglycosylase domain-containing protein n=1 Tax=Oricola sp. TaxID=1979950 RepID=UPI003BAB406D